MVSGKILGLLATLMYVLATLIPDTNWQGILLSPHLIAWPFVLFWQAGLICMVVVFLLRLWPQNQPFYLWGHGFDRLGLFLIAIVTLSTVFAEFRPQAIWQSGLVFAFITIGYGLYQDLKIQHHLLKVLTFQGLLQLVFILESLLLWISGTLLPELRRIEAFRAEGVTLTLDFSQLQLQNGFPLGHQNYVAGYLILALGLFIGLALSQRGQWRKVWIIGIVLGLVDLYTTSSRGGFLGLGVLLLAGFWGLFAQAKIAPAKLLGGFVVSLALALGLMLSNNRLRSLLGALFTPSGGGQFFYRAITSSTGWEIGASHWLWGAGPGSTPLVYQQFRPEWANRQAEMVFQLHSTPPQLWAELGLGGVLAAVWAAFLIMQWHRHSSRSPRWQEHQPIAQGLTLGLVGYGAVALTDYQLDVIAISTTIVIYGVVLIYLSSASAEPFFPTKYRKLTALIGWTVLGAGLVWLAPVDMAWQQSSLGFQYLAQAEIDTQRQRPREAEKQFERFQQHLERAHRLAPWESYYAFQLGWNLAQRGANEPNQSQSVAWQSEGLRWIQLGIEANPHQEFGYHHSAWLHYNLNQTQEAEKQFQQGLSLVPGKRSLSFGQGLSLLSQGKNAPGLGAIVTECFNDPLFVTSPLWRTQQLQGLYTPMLAQLEQRYQSAGGTPEKLAQAALHWWQGKPQAMEELRSTKTPVGILMSDVLSDRRDQLQSIIDRPHSPRELLIAAWYNPSQRRVLLNRAWIAATLSLNPAANQIPVDALFARMNLSRSFDQFLRSPLPLFTPLTLKLPRQRSGFGVLSRHIDGPNPSDPFIIENNAILFFFFADLFPEPSQLQPI